MNITIRPALETEIDTLLEFEKGIIEAERPYDPTLKEGTIHYYDLLSMVQSDEAEVVVALADNEIVGSGFAQIKEADPFLKYTHFVYLGFMFVKPEFRRKGINQKILDTLLTWARTKNISEVRLDVYDENSGAKKAYLKAGFKPHLLEMRIELTRGIAT